MPENQTRRDPVNSLAEHYRKQYAWRSWNRAYSHLPIVDGQQVLDLGCGIGDQTADLAQRGCHVVGIDFHEELIQQAQSRDIERATFRTGDLRQLNRESLGQFDGIWSSFAAAYFVQFEPLLSSWIQLLKPGGWIALIEIDDFFCHQPLEPLSQQLLTGYTDQAYDANRYDFRMGRKLRQLAQAVGLHILREDILPDLEFSSAGPASADVVAAWETRLNSMRLLQEFCGDSFDSVRDDFLRGLQSKIHKSGCQVKFLLAAV